MKNLSILIGFIFFFNCFSVLHAQEITWIDMSDLEVAQQKEPRKVIVDVYTNWCGWCKRMDATTFKDKKVIAYLNKKFYCVKLNGEDKRTLKFRGYSFKFVDVGRRGYNELAYEILQGKMSYPTFVFLNEELDVLQPIKGYKTAKELLPILTFLGDNIYKDKTWQEYIGETEKN
ncbi:MAG: thioredoxin family protein [Flavobacteriales bacterium]